MSSYLWPVVTWDERQTHQECTRRKSNSSRANINIYMATIWGQWGGLGGGKGGGLWALRGTQFMRSENALERVYGKLAMGLVNPRDRQSRSK